MLSTAVKLNLRHLIVLGSNLLCVVCPINVKIGRWSDMSTDKSPDINVILPRTLIYKLSISVLESGVILLGKDIVGMKPDATKIFSNSLVLACYSIFRKLKF